MAIRITGLNDSKTYLTSAGKKLQNEFQSEIIKRSKALAQKMQADMNAAVDKGPTSFTQRSVLFMYKKSGANSVRATIMIKNIQAQYLYDIIVKPKAIDKFIPTSAARLTKNGNIASLKANLGNGKYKVVKGKNGKERLIDTSKKDTKKKTKRVIGLRESKKRKLIYDFYNEAEKGVRLMISDISGSFMITKG